MGASVTDGGGALLRHSRIHHQRSGCESTLAPHHGFPSEAFIGAKGTD